MKVFLEIVKLILSYKKAADQTELVVNLILKAAEELDPIVVDGLEEFDNPFID